MTILTNVLTDILTGLSTGVVASGEVQIKDYKIAFIGDSYANAIAANATNRNALTAALVAAGADSATTGDAAQAGANLTENDTDNLWNLATSSKGALYTSLIDPFADKDTYNVGVLSIGTNDRSFLPGTTTEAEFKTGYQELLDQLKIDFPNIVLWMIYPAYRDNLSGNDEGLNIVRRVQREIVAENTDAYIIAESYDYTAQDDLHIDNASEILYGEDRIAGRIAKLGNLSSDTLLCPSVTGIEVTTEGLEFTIQHKDGSDITVPASTSPEMFFAITEFAQNDGRLDVTGYDVTRLSATKIRFDCGALTGVSTCGIGGAMTGLATNTVAPIVPTDNSTEGLPIQTCSLVPTDSDYMRTIGDVQAYVTADHIKTYNTGTDIDTIQSVNGRLFERSFTTYPTFNANAFGTGNAGIETTALTNRMLTALSMQADMMVYGAVEIPSSPSSNCEIFSLGNNGTTGITSAQLLVFSGSGVVRYNQGQSAGINIDGSNDYRGEKIVFVIDYKSTTNADIYISSPTHGDITLTGQDLNDTYSTQNRFLTGAGGTTIKELGVKYGDSSTLNSGRTIAGIISELKSRIGGF